MRGGIELLGTNTVGYDSNGNALVASCTAGFEGYLRSNASKLETITARHCFQVGEQVDDAQGVPVGTVSAFRSFDSSGDMEVIYMNAAWLKDNWVWLSASSERSPITSWNTTYNADQVGQGRSISGITTGYHSGAVTNTNVTVNYGADGNLPATTVRGMVQTNICDLPGDSGSPMFAGATAWGINSGGAFTASGGCTSPAQEFYTSLYFLGPNFQSEIQSSS